MAETTYVPGVAQFEQAPTGTGQVTYPSGMTTTFKTPTAKQQQAAGQSKLGDLIARMLQQIAQDKTGAYTAQQQQAAQGAFTKSYAETLVVTPQSAWDKVSHTGLSDYWAGQVQRMMYPGNVEIYGGSPKWAPAKVEQAVKNVNALKAEWSRRAEQSPYVTYPSGGVAAGKAHIPPYLEAGGWVSSYEYLANNPQYAIDFYESDPERAERLMANMYIPGVGSTYGGIDERVKSLQARALENLRIAQAQHTPPWMQIHAMPQTSAGTLPSWVQGTQGMTPPKW